MPQARINLELNTDNTADDDPAPRRTSVQSIVRVFTLLEAMADADGTCSASELAEISGLPQPTIHRLLRTVVELGYVRHERSREYSLGPGLMRLGRGASRLLGGWATRFLVPLAEQLGESANLAMLDNEEVVYVAYAPGRHSVRMITEVGRRVAPHCSAVGKSMLAALPEARLNEVLGRLTLTPYTSATITTLSGLLADLEQVRQRGYATEFGEHEEGVNSVAVALPHILSPTAISISGPSSRVTGALINTAVPKLKSTAEALAKSWVPARS
jgi:IclR family acetate operon transcriptional repressor